ncbi:MAG: class I SAM-dependent methyltransferase [Gemmatimonadetes bacterium]|nr:class I SAM-dependent methyltransferase [Gemmatimonadota bacterium]
MHRRDLALFLLSAALLAFEVLLLRAFAIAEFYHFAYMAISVAMLGFGASGTLLVLARRFTAGREARLFDALAALFAVALTLAPALAWAINFDSTQILWDPRQWIALALLYLALAIPFLVGAAAIAVAFMADPPRVGRLYAANLVGSAAGAALAIGLLALLPPVRAVAATALVAALAAAVALLRAVSRIRVVTALAVFLLAGLLAAQPPWTLKINPFKGLPQIEAYPEARRVGERWSPASWVVAVEAPPFRHAPGLSLAAPAEIPSQIALLVDGATAGAATRWAGDSERLRFLDWLPSAAPYAVRPAESVLVVGAGPGLDVLSALARGARRVTAVELSGALTELSESVVDSASRVYADPRVRLVLGDARAFTARTAEQFDLVVLAPLGAFGAGGTGVHGLAEDFLSTVEAYRRYLELLAPGGVLAVTHWVRAPPRDNVRALLTAAAALRDLGVDSVGSSLAFVRSWAAATLLVRPAGFSRLELARLAAFADGRLFDVDWPPRADRPPEAAYNQLPQPVFYDVAAAAAAGSAPTRAFVEAYPFDVRPPTDDRPYFGQFLRLASLPVLLRSPRGSWLPFAEWGRLALLATLAQSALVAVLLMLLPVAVAGWAGGEGGEGAGRGAAATGAAGDRGAEGAPDRGHAGTGYRRIAAYFGAIGFAYLFVEIAAIQKLTLLLGHPVYAAAAALAAFLACSGVGSAWSQRLPQARLPAACAVAAVLAAAVAVATVGTAALQSLPLAARLALAFLAIAPLATAMGLPFPLGIRRLAPRGIALAWAWATNGFASVLAASAGALIATQVGGRALLGAGGLMYLAAAMVSRGATRDAGDT